MKDISPCHSKMPRGGAKGCIGGLEFNKQIQLGSLCQFFSRLLPLLLERKKRKEELVDITKRKLGHDLGGYCKIPSLALEWS